MCGRFTIDIPPALLASIFGLAEPPTVTPRYNVAPTQQLHVIRQYADGQNHLDPLRWGLIPAWTKERSSSNLMINARSETVTEKPAFKQSIRYRRCVVPSSGFYEWQQEGTVKTPWYIQLKDGSPMVFAGLWDSWKSPEGEVIESCTILTTASNCLVELGTSQIASECGTGRMGTWFCTRFSGESRKALEPIAALGSISNVWRRSCE